MYRILFVCTGNICRSPMAEYLLKNLIKREYLKKLAEVESAGTGALENHPVAEFTATVCKKFGIDPTLHRARSITLDMVSTADLILCMALSNKLDLVKIFPHFQNKIFLLKQFARKNDTAFHSIEDPYGSLKEDYEKTFLEIKEELFRIWPEVTHRIEEKWLIENMNRR